MENELKSVIKHDPKTTATNLAITVNSNLDTESGTIADGSEVDEAKKALSEAYKKAKKAFKTLATEILKTKENVASTNLKDKIKLAKESLNAQAEYMSNRERQLETLYTKAQELKKANKKAALIMENGGTLALMESDAFTSLPTEVQENSQTQLTSGVRDYFELTTPEEERNWLSDFKTKHSDPNEKISLTEVNEYLYRSKQYDYAVDNGIIDTDGNLVPKAQ